jgi:GNAT superfamily N-acetyltransferase
MSFTIQRLDSPSSETVKAILDAMSERDEVYSHTDHQSEHALAHLPEQTRVFTAADSRGPIGLLVFCQGVFDPWGAPTDMLGTNPILPNGEIAEEVHSALLAEAKSWATETSTGGLEIFLPMGPANMQRDEALDGFYETLGFDRFYYTMTRDISSLSDVEHSDIPMKIVPASSISVDELYINFADSLAHGEIEFMSSMPDDDQREYFESLVEETISHKGSLALLGDVGVVGFTLVTTMPDAGAHLAWIGMLPNHRGKGLGQSLLYRTMTACQTTGARLLSLYTDSTVDAQSLYLNLAFEPAGALAYRWKSKKTSAI